jgi:hypothetical protein
MSCEGSSGGWAICEKVIKLRGAVSRAQKRRKSDLPLQALDVLPADLVIQHMRNLIGGDLFSRRTLVNSAVTSAVDGRGPQKTLTQPWSLQ